MKLNNELGRLGKEAVVASVPPDKYRDNTLGICLEGLRKTTTNLKIVGVPAEIRTSHLPNTSQKRFSSNQLAC
jgi:hypothetical protein